MLEQSWNHWKCLLALSILLTLMGCGSAEDTPERYQISGTVSFDGKPVPTGEIVINPDAGNTGEGSYAVIKNGKYETAPGQGVSGGA